MSQISPPIRVLAVCALAFLAAWTLFLRPKPEAAAPAEPAPAAATPAATAAPGSATGTAVQQANGAAAATDARASDVTGDTAPATTTTPAGEPAPAAGDADADPEALRKLPADVRRAIRRDQVLVLLFWNRRSADDRAVRRAVRRIDRWEGRVFVDHADVRNVSRYGPITRGARLEQSPTVVVVDRDLEAEALVGFVDTRTLDQAVLDALRESGPLLTDRYLREVNRVCDRTAFVPQPANLGRAQVKRYFSRATRVIRRLDRRFTAIEAPKRWRAFEAATHRDHVAMLALFREGERAVLRRDAAAFARVLRRDREIVERYDARMDDEHVLACGSSA